ncbi:MAG: DUF262 domain-containing protein [Dictyoglomaceae bacterium]
MENIRANSITIGDILNDGRIYEVPQFQRSYSWEENQIKDFWNDLVNVYETKEKNYFIGSMVFTYSDSEKKVRVLDGQQRLATILLLLAALRDVLKNSKIEKKEDRIDEINRVIFFRDIVTIDRYPKLEMNREDKEFYKSVVIDGEIDKNKIIC